MILKSFLPGYKEFDPSFGFLFNSYYNSIGERTVRENRGDLSRPTVARVFEYRKYVDEKMVDFLTAETPDKCLELLELGLNHEQQHQELLLTDLKFSFGLNPLFPVYRDNYFPEEAAEKDIYGKLEIEGGVYQVGHKGNGFCFDNELSRHDVLVNDFEISQSLVTNADFLTFVADGGYKDFRHWHSEAWDWVTKNEIAAPLYWHKKDDEWFAFTLGGLRPLDLKAPVCHVSFYEAYAYAEWRGLRLPTEFEWEIASDKFDWGKRWEWTASAYLPYPGFAKDAGAVGEYNGKFMINQMVLRGASVATPTGHSRNTYRNFFQPHLRWQFTGIRLVK
jgi:ergothioneine biosynthesis protein EgtB